MDFFNIIKGKKGIEYCSNDFFDILFARKYGHKPLKLVPWQTGTDEEIAAMIDGYYAGIYTLDDIKTVWAVGDTRTVNLSAMPAGVVVDTHRAQSVEMVILEFNRDELVEPINGKTKALITVNQKDCLTGENTGEYGGLNNVENGVMNAPVVANWTETVRRRWCNEVYLNALPDYFKNSIKQVIKRTSSRSSYTTILNSNEYIYLLARTEVFSEYGELEGKQYEYFHVKENKYKKPYWNSTAVSSSYWLRTPDNLGGTKYHCVRYTGLNMTFAVDNKYGLAPAMSL